MSYAGAIQPTAYAGAVQTALVVPTYDELLDEAVAYFPLGDQESGSTAINRAGADGTYIGSPDFVDGLAPNSEAGVRFDGVGQYVDADGISTSATDLTFSCWVNSTQTGTQSHLLTLYPNSIAFSFIHGSDKLALFSLSAWDDFGDTPNDGEDHHIAFVVEGTTAKCYVDGVQSGSDATITAISLASATAASIGTNYPGTDDFFEGVLDEAIILPRALSPDEVLRLYEDKPRRSSTYAQLKSEAIAYFPMDDSTGTNVVNLNGTDGTFTGTANDLADPWDVGYGALDFDGVDGKVTFPEVSLGEFTLSINVNLDSVASDTTLFGKFLSNFCKILAGGGTIQSKAGGDLASIALDSALLTGVWNHIVLTRDSDGLVKCYINGTLQTATDTSPISNVMDLLTIGTTNSIWWINGTVRDAFILSRALTLAEVLALSDSTQAPGYLNTDPSAVARWPLEEQVIGTHYDVIGGNHGTASGGVTVDSAAAAPYSTLLDVGHSAGHVFTKTETSSWNNAGVDMGITNRIGTKLLDGGHGMMVGLDVTRLTTNHADYDYGWYYLSATEAYVKSTADTGPFTVAVGDFLEVVREGDTVSFLQNGAVIDTRWVDESTVLYGCSSVYASGKTWGPILVDQKPAYVSDSSGVTLVEHLWPRQEATTETGYTFTDSTAYFTATSQITLDYADTTFRVKLTATRDASNQFIFTMGSYAPFACMLTAAGSIVVYYQQEGGGANSAAVATVDKGEYVDLSITLKSLTNELIVVDNIDGTYDYTGSPLFHDTYATSGDFVVGAWTDGGSAMETAVLHYLSVAHSGTLIHEWDFNLGITDQVGSNDFIATGTPTPVQRVATFDSASTLQDINKAGILSRPTPRVTDGAHANTSTAIRFDGVDQYVDATGVPALPDDWSISLWALPSDSTTDQYLLDFSGENEAAIVKGFQDGYYNIFGSPYPTATASDTQIPITGSSADHLVFTKSGTTLKGYLNGSEYFSETIVTAGDFSPSAGVRIGSAYALASYYEGVIDEVMIFEKALTATEVMHLSNPVSASSAGSLLNLLIKHSLNNVMSRCLTNSERQ